MENLPSRPGLIARAFDAIKRARCRHDYLPPKRICSAEWKFCDFPHPTFRGVTIPLEKRTFLAVLTCKKCGHSSEVEGYDTRPLEDTVPGVRNIIEKLK